MKKLNKIAFVIFLFFAFSSLSFGQKMENNADSTDQRPKVGLVLSGGGAKGFAQIGVLEAIDDLGIPIDYVVGTSIGSIMGGLYATGYTGKLIADESVKQNWTSVFTDQTNNRKIPVSLKDEVSRYTLSFPMKGGIRLPKGIVRGQKVMNVLSRYTIDYHEPINFSELPIPYSCIAVDLETGEAVVLEKGQLAQAMRASMAIPSVFTPQEIGDRLFIDGGVVNNFPTDVAKAKGCDYIIGVDVQSPLRKKEELSSATDIVKQLISLNGKKRRDANIKLADIYIHPDITDFTTSSFSKEEVDTLIERGRDAAKEAYPELVALKKKLGINVRKKAIPTPTLNRHIKFSHLKVSGLKKTSDELFYRKLHLNKKDSISLVELETTIDDVSAILDLDLLNYQLINDTLKFTANERANNRFNVGVHYDNNNDASLLLNTTINNILFKNSRVSIDAILGRNLQFTGRYTIKFGDIPYLNMIFDAKKYNLALYEKNDKIAEGDISYAKFDINAQMILWDTYSVGIGIRKEYVDIGSTLSTYELAPKRSNDWYTNHYGFISLNTLDNVNYPKQGVCFNGEVKYISNGNKETGTVVYANFKRARLFSENFAIMWSLYGRAILDSQLGLIYENYWGGITNTQYLDKHIPFMGANWMQGHNSAMGVGRLDLRYELFNNNYLILTGNYGRYSQDSEKFFTSSSVDIWGGGITYSYDSIIGPIALSVTHSTEVKKPLLYISIGYNF